MSVLIKGVDMPSNCFDCPCCEGDSGYCQADKARRYVYGDRPDWCPLGEVPTPHGRLKDADALIKYVLSISKSSDNKACILQQIDFAPTVIEAEERE